MYFLLLNIVSRVATTQVLGSQALSEFLTCSKNGFHRTQWCPQQCGSIGAMPDNGEETLQRIIDGAVITAQPRKCRYKPCNCYEVLCYVKLLDGTVWLNKKCCWQIVAILVVVDSNFVNHSTSHALVSIDKLYPNFLVSPAPAGTSRSFPLIVHQCHEFLVVVGEDYFLKIEKSMITHH